ncbi:4'-phosphopantetheinyl transferase family protein [Fangia hongkongensis]|uniref:4'-phosphopantetheinyl transferase family protein n=1 Tax=Fangia hongkongensis TaxID=270495 RepID=UPI0003621B32|nr:4'-phosphopantetheinyl transferase superfamily protein [Fangia hongkongensis]MBK2125958.1 4'-phosphopantetheinyl transferase superfamily protein [Fangia hongkongensis]
MIAVYIVPVADIDLTVLSLPDEIHLNAQKFKHPKKRSEYLVSQWIRRDVLLKYYNVELNQQSFYYSEKGRPYLENSVIDFNISHTDQYVLMAVSAQQMVGIDVQSVKEKTDVLSIAKHYFSPSEYKMLSSLSEKVQKERFYQIWTLKEASLKLTGEGIANGLVSYSFFVENHTLVSDKTSKSKDIYYYSGKLSENILLSLASNKPIKQLEIYCFSDKGWQRSQLSVFNAVK